MQKLQISPNCFAGQLESRFDILAGCFLLKLQKIWKLRIFFKETSFSSTFLTRGQVSSFDSAAIFICKSPNEVSLKVWKQYLKDDFSQKVNFSSQLSTGYVKSSFDDPAKRFLLDFYYASHIYSCPKIYFLQKVSPEALNAFLTGMLKLMLPKIALCYRSKSRIDNKSLTFPKIVVHQNVLLDTLNSALKAMLETFHQISDMFFAQTWRMMTSKFFVNWKAPERSFGQVDCGSQLCRKSFTRRK